MGQLRSFAKIEPDHPQRRLAGRIASEPLEKANLSSIAAVEVLVLATAIAQAVVGSIELQDKRKERRYLALAAVALAFLIGIARCAVQLIK